MSFKNAKQIPRAGIAKTKPGKGAKPMSNGPMPKTPSAKGTR